MVPKLHAKGTSFKGAAAYLLHDKGRAKSAKRVEWIELRNFATDDPDIAWRVMAATAMDQDRLKDQAGVKATGRKSVASVLHVTLAWHPSEKDGLTRDEMLRASAAAIRALEAGDRQAMIICHNDEEHPHVHVLINRVSMEDGRMLSSSKEKLNLSRWAQSYEKERGAILCEERVLNNEARDRGHFTRGKKNRARNVYEMEPANDNGPKAKAIREEQRKKDADVAKAERETKQRHRQNWLELQARHQQRVATIRQNHARDLARQKEALRARFRPEYHMLMHEHQAETAHFLANEKSVLGRVANALRAIDFRGLVGGRAADPERRQTLGQAFDALSSAGARLETMKQRQAGQKREIEAKERKEEQEIERAARQARAQELDKNRDSFEKERGDLILTQRMEGAKHRTDWKTRTEQREKAWENASLPPAGGQSRDLTREEKLAERLRQIEQYRERIRSQDKSRDKDHGRDRDD